MFGRASAATHVCRYHKLTLTLLKASWRRAQRLVAERRSAIVQVAEEMLAAEDERVSGARLITIIEVGCGLR